MAAAVPIAFDDVNSSAEFDGWKFHFTWRDSGCKPGQALKAMMELLSFDVDALIGPGCSVSCEPTQLLASTINMAQACFFVAYDTAW